MSEAVHKHRGRGTRNEPLQFPTLQQAIDYAHDNKALIWCRVFSWAYLFQIYPGGRIVRY